MQSIFGFIIYPMELGLVALTITVGSAGIGIILFTILVRLVLSPLQITQLRSAKSMQRVQPLIAELKQKHGKDREALTRDTMALYKEHKVNPAMGCLPTLVQFPILIGLFYALLHLGNSTIPSFPNTCNGFVTHNSAQWFQHCYAIKGAIGSTSHIYSLFHAHFLWLSNGLGKHDPLYILPVLAGATQWIQSRMMLTKSTDPQQQMMNSMMNFMPLMIVFFATQYASGLSLYWVTSTLIGILIQYRITGWGLLPETLGRVIPSMAPAVVSTKGRSSAPSKPVTRSTPKLKTAPAKASDGAEGGGEPRVQTDLNGQNGSEPRLRSNGAVSPRKKANRAKGGRGGGRRG